MDFTANKLPSVAKEIEWYWAKCLQEDIDYSAIKNNAKQFDFTRPMDYFELTEEKADSISSAGADLDFFSEPVALKEFEMNIFGDLSMESQIGKLLSCVSQRDTETVAYAIYANYIYIEKAVYCAITVGIVDGDSGMEAEVAVVEISKDEGAYVQPIAINEDILYYFSFDDIMKLSYWLGNFWLGIQYKMNHRPEEIREVEHRESLTEHSENNRTDKRIVLVRKIIPVDSEGNVIDYNKKGSGRKYKVPSWGVSGRWRTLADGRDIYIQPYYKGKDREKREQYVNKQYKFVDEADAGRGEKGE